MSINQDGFGSSKFSCGLAFAMLLSSSILMAQKQQGFDSDDPSFSGGVRGHVKVLVMGPYTIPAGRKINGKIVPGEMERNFAAPHPGDVFMTGYDSRIVDSNMVPCDPAELFLHHSVLVKRGSRDLTCLFMPGERFTASGSERIPVALPRGYGYPIRSSEAILNILHIQNFTLTPQKVYYQFSMTVEPLNVQPPLTAVRPWWLDVKLCTSSYIVPTGTGLHVKQRDYGVSNQLTLLELGPHLHCGGVKLEVINKTTGRPIHTFLNKACPVEMQPIVPVAPIVLSLGTTVTLKATYQQLPNEPIDAMGIMLAYVLVK